MVGAAAPIMRTHVLVSTGRSNRCSDALPIACGALIPPPRAVTAAVGVRARTATRRRTREGEWVGLGSPDFFRLGNSEQSPPLFPIEQLQKSLSLRRRNVVQARTGSPLTNGV